MSLQRECVLGVRARNMYKTSGIERETAIGGNNTRIKEFDLSARITFAAHHTLFANYVYKKMKNI